MTSPIILDCAGPTLTPDERALYRDHQPFGFILFARHCMTPDQVKALVMALKDSVGRDVPVLIDQEGGRVARLCPPHWRRPPAAAAFAALWETDEEAAIRAAWINSRIIAAELTAVGVSVDCLPVLDLRFAGAHQIIGDRAYGEKPEPVIALGRAAAEGLLAGGVVPVIKHIPGHGRAAADSHLELPRVSAPLEALRRLDFAPFAALAGLPAAMTAHIVYDALDPDTPATWSRAVVQNTIRQELGFKGALMSDDITMKALDGPLTTRAQRSLDAGCDLVLLCNAEFADRRDVLAATPPLAPAAFEKLHKLMMPPPPQPADIQELETELDKLLAAGETSR